VSKKRSEDGGEGVKLVYFFTFGEGWEQKGHEEKKKTSKTQISTKTNSLGGSGGGPRRMSRDRNKSLQERPRVAKRQQQNKATQQTDSFLMHWGAEER